LASLHAVQFPVQVPSQHTPSTQFVERHSLPASHIVPSVFLARQTMVLEQ
jgi:hypothetical protein